MPSRCKKGTRRNKQTGNCETNTKLSTAERTRIKQEEKLRRTQFRQTMENVLERSRATIPGYTEQEEEFRRTHTRARLPRCKKGTRRNKRTGNCEAKS